jgi:hypothetical protein
MLAVLGLAGCDKGKLGEQGDASGSAKSLDKVRTIRVEANSCAGGIGAALADRGFSPKESGKVDAVMQVNVSHTGRNLDNIPSFGGIGNKATYAASLRGARDKELFSTSGSEGSINQDELCQDIGDDIADRLKSRHG